jgi:parvulin-like peptidyl-prolyl isomerase
LPAKAIFVMSHGARLVTALFVALVVRAVAAQQGGYRGDPYAPVPGSGYGVQARPPQRPTSETNQSLRYPLPQSVPPAAPAAQPAATTQAAVPQVASLGPPAANAVLPRNDLFQPGLIVARVGDKAIFYGDVAPIVNLILEPHLAKAKTDAERQELEAARGALTKNEVRKMVQDKLMYLEWDREMKKNVGTDPKKKADSQAKLDKNVRNYFEKALAEFHERMRNASPEEEQKLMAQDPTLGRLALLMKNRQIESLGELEKALKPMGTSLEQQMRMFGEHTLGIQAIVKQITKDPEVTHQEMLDYYSGHSTEYAVRAKARFEILTAKFASFPSRPEALVAIEAMGNQVYLGGTPFAAVARKLSQEPNAANGGYYDWVNEGSLASGPIDRAIFMLETGKLSQIIEDDVGYHIIRVIERQPAGQISFLDAQDDIKKAIKAQKKSAEQQKILEQLHTKTEVWTIYDEVATAQ